MGLDVDVYLLVGLPYHDVVEDISETVESTKYNEDTGHPYCVPKVIEKYKVGDIVLDNDDYDEIELLMCKNGLSCFGLAGYIDFIGLMVDRVDNNGGRIAHGQSEGVSLLDMSAKVEEVKRNFRKLGITEEPIIVAFSSASY